MQLQARLKIFVPISKNNHIVLCRGMAIFCYKNRKKRKYATHAKL
jgi:hypothetical protein